MPRNSPRPGTPPGIRSNCALAPLPAPIAPVPIDGRRKPRYHILITLGQRDKPRSRHWTSWPYTMKILLVAKFLTSVERFVLATNPKVGVSCASDVCTRSAVGVCFPYQFALPEL